MKNLTDSEVSRLKDVLFKWLGNEDIQVWATAAAHLIRLGEISTQETQTEALQYMKKFAAALDEEEQEGGKK